ncbi:hypothetical protein YC2023_037487 [Brassica napus]
MSGNDYSRYLSTGGKKTSGSKKSSGSTKSSSRHTNPGSSSSSQMAESLAVPNSQTQASPPAPAPAPAAPAPALFAPRKKGRLYGVDSLNTSLRSVPASFPSSSTRDQSLEKIIYDQAQKIESQGNEISKLYKIVRHLASKDSTVADILQSEDVSSASGDDDESDAI